MDLSINVREIEGITLLELTGHFTAPEGYASVRKQVKQLLATNKTEILLDLAKVTVLDSGGLGTLVETFVSTRRRGGERKLVNVTEKIRKPFVLTRLVTFFEIYANEHEALASFK